MKSLLSKSWLVVLVCQVMVMGASLPAFGQPDSSVKENSINRYCPGKATGGYTSGLVTEKECKDAITGETTEYQCFCDDQKSVSWYKKYSCTWTKKENPIATNLGKCSIDPKSVDQHCSSGGGDVDDSAKCKAEAVKFCNKECGIPDDEPLPIPTKEQILSPGISG